MSNRLIRRYTSYVHSDFNDYLMLFAANIEEAWIGAGAVPSEDYSRADVLAHATEAAMKQFFSGEGMTISSEYRDFEIDN